MAAFTRCSVIESTIERAVPPVAKFGQATMTQSLLALRGGGGDGGGGIGGAIDGVGVLTDRIATLIQLAAVVYAIYLVLELKKQVDTMKDMAEERLEEVKAGMKTQWDNGWTRQNKAMKELVDGFPMPGHLKDILTKIFSVQVDEDGDD